MVLGSSKEVLVRCGMLWLIVFEVAKEVLDDRRGAIVACAIPWLRSLLLQHASIFMFQESSLVALNSLYQLIESRVSTLRPALQLASHLDLLDAGIEDGEVDEFNSITPAIYEDKDSEDESEDAMDTDEEDNKNEDLSDISDD
ncbi:hypothetical protein Dimus_036372 [Dionaea muscipula]